MAGNSIGRALVLTTFGESHGVAMGGVLDGLPANIPIDTQFIQSELNRRRPGLAPHASPRREEDQLQLLSGIYEGRSTGAPIAFLVTNQDQRPADYDTTKDLFRPSHADYTYQQKYGFRDPRGGGRSSARETVARVAGGALAKLFLQEHGITISGWVSQIGPFLLGPEHIQLPSGVEAHLDQLREAGDTTGGTVSCSITGIPPGVGEPVFDKLQADLAKAMLSINAVKGFEYGSGFASAAMKGSEHNDPFVMQDGAIRTRTNHSGGIQGGISNGEEILFRVAFKPVSTLMAEQQTLNTSGEPVTFRGSGRHDVCVVPRAVVVVEAMAALTIADHLLRFIQVPVATGNGKSRVPR